MSGTAKSEKLPSPPLSPPPSLLALCRRSIFIWMAATIAAVALGACIVVNPPPAPTPTPMPSPTPTRQTAINVVRIVEGGDPVVVGQTVRVALTLDEESYSDRGRWQWERSDDGLSGWQSVPGARLTDSSLYVPLAADEDKYLRASVPFVDSDDIARIGISLTIGPVATAGIDTNTVFFTLDHDPVVVRRVVRANIALTTKQYSQPGRWRWDRSDNGLRDWTDVTDYDADDPSIYTPGPADKGKYLRASIVYLDSEKNYKRGLSPTRGPVITVETVADVVSFTAGWNPPTVGTEVRVGLTLHTDQYSRLGHWKWERSKDGLSGWVDVTDYGAAHSSRYTPSSADAGYYLRASNLYLDSEGERKRALSQTIGPVAK